MSINLLTGSMLGHWRTSAGVWQCEFQFGSQLVYVQHLDHESLQDRLVAAQGLLEAVWSDMAQALEYAEQHCRAQMPELMRLYETHMPWESPLAVWSVHFDVDDPAPGYLISRNHDFDWGRRLIDEDELGQEYSVCMEQYEPDEDYCLVVKRLGPGRFLIEA